MVQALAHEALAALRAHRRDWKTELEQFGGHPVEWLWAIHDELPADAYPPGVVPATVHIRGTAAFPGGTGLTMETGGPLPNFPVGGVMVVAQDLDAEETYMERATSGQPHGDPRRPMDYWKNTCKLFDRAGLDSRRCFFTNVFVGLRVGRKASGGPFPGRNDLGFAKWCREFLDLQAEVMRPTLVVFFGNYARAAYGLAGGTITTFSLADHETLAVTLAYPNRAHLTAKTRSYAGFTGPEAEVALLRDALSAMPNRA